MKKSINCIKIIVIRHETHQNDCDYIIATESIEDLKETKDKTNID